MRQPIGIAARALGLVAAFALLARSDDGPGQPPVPNSPDFRIEIREFGLDPKPVVTAQVVVREGRAYQITDGSDEIIIVDPRQGRVELLNLGKNSQTAVTLAQLAESRAKLRTALNAIVARQREKGGRASLELARITEALVEPKFRVEDPGKPGRVRLVNSAVEVDATGEPEPDAARREMIALTLDAIVDLGAHRVPNDLPPFAELDALSALLRDRQQRPTELNYLFRLAGPPRRLRRTYRFFPELTDREVEATRRLDLKRTEAPIVRFERYERIRSGR